MLLFGCLRRMLALALLVAAVGAAYYYRADIELAWDRARGVEAPAEPSEELAEAAVNQLERIESSPDARVALSELEVQSLAMYRPGLLFPPLGDSVAIRLEDGRVRLRTRIAMPDVSAVAEFREIRELLPDTAEVDIRGQLIPLDSGRAALAVDRVSASGVPVPGRFVPTILERFGGEAPAGTPEDAIPLSLPPGVAAAYIRADSLILLGAGRTNGNR